MSKLGNVRRGRIPSALRYLFYGVEGVGKSSLAAHAPNPIYLDLEDGTSLIECGRYPFRDEPGGHVAQSYEEVLSALDDLLAAEHEFETVVIDTVDRLEPLLWAYCCERDSRGGKSYKNIESYGYGKGYGVALDEWRAFCHKLDQLRTKRLMNVVLVGHAQIRTFKNPEGPDYDRYSVRLNEKAAGFLREWCDLQGFCSFEGGAGKTDGARAKGFATGQRLVQLERTAAYDAKTRLPLPTSVVLSADNPWQPFGEAAALFDELGPDVTAEQLTERIEAELKRISDSELTEKVAAILKGRGDDTQSLTKLLLRLKGK